MDNSKTIIDFISGKTVANKPEEVDAVQPFSEQLVKDYGYPKAHIQTRPQYKVKSKPSDKKGVYPVDIAVFDDNKELYIVVECKNKNIADGRNQLEDYMKFSSATLGVWYNGNDKLFLKKIETTKGIDFTEIPNIPNYGQRVEDIGQFKRQDLKPPHNLKAILKSIRSHLAGNFTGATRDEELAKQIINIIFAKIYDEKWTKSSGMVEFRIGVDENKGIVKKRIENLFEKVKKRYKDIISEKDEIILDEDAVAYVVGELQNFCITECERDAVADSFEIFIGHALKGSQGQFFTPRNVTSMLVKIMNPVEDDVVVDPACGSGGFLIESLRHIWGNIEQDRKKLNWSEAEIQKEKMKVAEHNIKGIEKDNFLARTAKAYMSMIGDGSSGIYCADSLKQPKEWDSKVRQDIPLNSIDKLLTNPPFGKEIKIEGKEKLKQFDLGHKWSKDKNGDFVKSEKCKKEQVPHILFIERCMQIVKNGSGKVAIILPEIVFHGKKESYVMNYICAGNNIEWIIDLPGNTFQPYTGAKCIAIIFEKGKPQNGKVNMAVAEEIGHDHRGNTLYRWDDFDRNKKTEEVWDDTIKIIEEVEAKQKKHYCFDVKWQTLKEKGIFVPRYYWQNQQKQIEIMAKKNNLTLISLNELLEEGIITYFDGHGSPEAKYKGRGDYPYIRVKDIVNFEIYKDPTAMLPREIYEQMRNDEKVNKTGDILFVRRGSQRIGSIAMASPEDINMILTREIISIRVVNEKNRYNMNPYYLLWLLSQDITTRQIRNKVLIDTTITNIGDRWKELTLGISTSNNKRVTIGTKMQEAIQKKWEGISLMNKMM